MKLRVTFGLVLKSSKEGFPDIWRSWSTGGSIMASIKHGFFSLKMVAIVICKYLKRCKLHGIESAMWTMFLGVFFLPCEDGRAALAYKAYKLVQHRNAIREPKIQWWGTCSIGSSPVPALTNAVTGSLCSILYQNLTSFSLHHFPSYCEWKPAHHLFQGILPMKPFVNY